MSAPAVEETKALDVALVLNETKAAQPDDSTCPICLESFDEKTCVTLEGCSHKFHAHCAIRWFRAGRSSCPLCRYTPAAACDHQSFSSREARLQLNRRFARLKRAPKQLKELCQKLTKLNKARISKVKEFKAWRESEEGRRYKSLKKKFDNHKRRCCRWRNQSVRKVQNQIANFPIIPILMT